MKAVRVTRYIADCGKGFWNKSAAINHDDVCRCWKNPKFRTCKACKHLKIENDSNGMEDEPQFLQTWKNLVCTNPEFIHDVHFTPAHENASDLCINCPVWEPKK